MLNKKYKILILLSILLFSVGLVSFLLTKNNNIVNTDNVIKELIKQPLNTELEVKLVDLKGPKQKYINKTYGFSLEFLDEIELFNNNYKINNLKESFTNERTCLKGSKNSNCNILDKIYNFRLFYWIGFDLNMEKELEQICNNSFIEEKNRVYLNEYKNLNQNNKFNFKEIGGKINNLNFKGIEFNKKIIEPVGGQPEIRVKTHRKNSDINIYLCLNKDTLLNFNGNINTYIDDTKRFNILYKQIYEVVNSLELLSE
ncbi:MAG: hypothetical protein L3J07_00175 [Candidatus Magasanikbacteria bacterium]|nr:hypothetical protein [Candidatus Magasanikbacteria bacterium]